MDGSGSLTRRDFAKQAVLVGATATCTGTSGLTRAATRPAPFAPAFFALGKNCALWPLGVPAFRLNMAYIASPRAGESREKWLEALHAYRHAVRTGAGDFGVRMHPGSFDRRNFLGSSFDSIMTMHGAVAAAYDLRPGERTRVVADLRMMEGEGVLGVAFRLRQRATDADGGAAGRPVEHEVSVLPNLWRPVEIDLLVPDFDYKTHLAVPVITFKGEDSTPFPQLDIRSLVFVVDDEDRMRRAFEARRATHELSKGIDRSSYDRKDLAAAHTLQLTFVWDVGFYDPDKDEYLVDSILDDGERELGGYDGVLLWFHNPRFGMDARNHFDCIRDMPGGLPALKEVSRRLHRRGVKLYIPEAGAYRRTIGPRPEGKPDEVALAEIIAAIDADGVVGDTLGGGFGDRVNEQLQKLRPGKKVVFEPEIPPALSQLGDSHGCFAWRLVDPEPPGIHVLKWIEPRHVMRSMRLYKHLTDGSRSHRRDIAEALFNGEGTQIHEQYGVYMPWSNEDRRLWRRASGILHHCADFFRNDEWEPFYPTLTEGLYANRWRHDGMDLFTMVDQRWPRAEVPLVEIPARPGAVCFDLWSGAPLETKAGSHGKLRLVGRVEHFGALLVTRRQRVDKRLRAFLDRQRREAVVDTGNPQRNFDDSVISPLAAPEEAPPCPRTEIPTGMVRVPGATFRMRLEHKVDEYGCHPDPGTPRERWKYFLEAFDHGETLKHDIGPITLPDFCIDEAQVTNAEYARFLAASGYRPRHMHNFLKHWPGAAMPPALAEHPVVYVDLDDARAYARWAGKRLPTEEEWHLAAQGTDGRAWPWGKNFAASKCNPGGRTMPVRSFREGRSPHGCYNMSGNVWELTESLRSDGHIRFCLIRGGSFQHNSGSTWFLPSGPQPCTYHAKLIMMWPGLDRCSTIGFRCMKPMKMRG